MNELVILFILLTATLFFWAILVRLFQQKLLMKERLNEYIFNENSTDDKDKQIKKIVTLTSAKEKVRKQLKSTNKNERIQMMLQQAGVPLKPEEYVMFQWISIAFFAGFFYLLKNSIVILIFGVLFGFVLPKLIIKSKQKKRLRKFNDYLPEMISTAVNALRAGFSFFQALKNVMEESPSPVKEELEIVLKEMQYGTTVEEALNRLKDRMPSEDLDLMIQAIVIQRQVGGNLAMVLEKIVHTIRERISIQGQIRTLTAQGKMSGTVVALLPVGLAGILFLVNPSYMIVLFTNPIGLVLLCIGAISMVLGYFFISKITSIEV
ncbi:type II secretion system F family protein [Lederbergia panacisoli]|uniref:type II secretion system F family protein n=1 Tax=Lederbergia panacisoli TaxID=1255251 RepID=UPI00214BFD1B|nr:type II secretion system F family protein [Lederbergia panacisoli]MCR2823188.1 type II secretion system F family protein [Lederbergia panacisoli]